MPRLDTPGVEPGEGLAADAIKALASDIERLCYVQDAQGIAPETVKELHRCFRILKRACFFFYAENHGLVWDPPTGRFEKKGDRR